MWNIQFNITYLKISIIENYNYFTINGEQISLNTKFNISNHLIFFHNQNTKIKIKFKNYGVVLNNDKICELNIRVCYDTCLDCKDIDGDENPVHEKGFIDNLKINQRLMRRNYDIAIKNKKTNFFELLITEMIDKIYITKIIFFTKKFDLFSLQISVYLLCHTLLLVLNALFFDIKTIKKIWIEENYPGLGYYLGFGLLSCIIIWIIYKVFLCLLSNNDKIKEY